jgi:hypothetical protein
MLNGWFIDNLSTEYLYGGAIQTNGWTGGVIRAISYNATTAFVAADIGRTITGTTTTDSGTIVDFDDRYTQDDQGVVYIRPDDPATDLFDNGTEAYTVGSSSAAGSFDEVFTGTGNASISGESLWANPFSLGSIVTYTDLFFYQSEARVVSKAYNVTTPLQWWDNGHVDVLINVRELGQQVDNGFVTVLARQGTTQHDFFQSDLSGGGRQPLPLSAATDLNDQVGFREMVFTDSAGNWAAGDRIEDDTDTTIRGIIVNVASSNPTIEVQYYLIGDPLNDFTGATGTLNNMDDTGTATAVAPTNVNGAVAGGVTVTVGLVNEDINNGNGSLPYSVIINPNSVVLTTVFQRLKYLLRRGATTDLDVTNYTGVPGEVYKGVEARIDFSAQTGTFTQGELLYDQNTGAVGRVVAIDNTNDYVMLGQVKGTFVAAAAALGDAVTSPTDFATIDTVEVVTPVKACALGSLAGGVFFGARGVALDSSQLNSADVQNYQLIDNVGDVQIPPNVISVAVQAILARNTGSHTGGTSGTVLIDSTATFQTAETNGEIKVGDIVYNVTDGSRGTIVSIDSETQITTSALTGGISNDWTTGGADNYAITVGDRVAVFRVDGSGDISRDTLTSGAGNVAGDTDFVCNATIPSDTPSLGWLRVVDVTDGSERRYRYASWATTTFTLVVPTDSGGNPTSNDATNGAVAMDDTSADFTGSAVPVRVGDEIRNSTDGGIATITAVYDQRLEHTPLAGGTNNDWETTDTYVINALTQAYDSGADTAYAPIIDTDNIVEGVTELSNSLVFDTSFNVRIIVRQGKVILPINGSGQVTSAGLTFPAGRILDTIAA